MNPKTMIRQVVLACRLKWNLQNAASSQGKPYYHDGIDQIRHCDSRGRTPGMLAQVATTCSL